MFKSLLKSIIRILYGIALLLTFSVIFFLISGYYAALKPVVFLPEIQPGVFEPCASDENQIKIVCPWYTLKVDECGKVVIETHSGEAIMSGLLYYSKYEGSDEKWGLDNVSVKQNSDSTILIHGERCPGVIVSVLLTVKKNIPKIDVNITTNYNTETIVKQEALVAAFAVPVSEVYLKNRQIDSGPFHSEYWLERQGVRFGNGKRSALIYHTPNTSSLQLNSEKNLLFINLENFMDHPAIHIPYQEDEGGKWSDISEASYTSGSARNNKFSVYFGNIPDEIPRLMLVPDGYMAGYIFSEHADGGNMERNRAVYLGSEDISNIDNAIGGFVGHRIPVTKSVFFVYPPGSSVRDEPLYLNFLKQLDSTGLFDICLHTPDDQNSNREILEESIKFMKDRFNTICWIDHGFYGGKINRESFVCDGLDSISPFYAADLWEKYDTRYFWSPADELINDISLKQKIRKLKFKDASCELWKRHLSQYELKEMTFFTAFFQLLKRPSSKYEMNSMKPIKGESFPTPLYWQNITRTGQFYSWVTNYVKDYDELAAENSKSQFALELELENINKLINDWGVFINHGYYVRNRTGSDHGIWTEQQGKIIINPNFDSVLENMARLRDEGSLYITTIRDLLDYWILIENISFEYMPDGIIHVFNNNDKSINGLSLVVRANSIRVNDEIPKFKKVGENTIFWFNMQAKEGVCLQVTP
jgi:hypothetical protein